MISVLNRAEAKYEVDSSLHVKSSPFPRAVSPKVVFRIEHMQALAMVNFENSIVRQ
jgi:hypothetical protein